MQILNQAAHPWPYPELTAMAKEDPSAWMEVSQAFYDANLAVLPPLYVTDGWLVSEPDHDDPETGAAVYAGFTTWDGRYFARYSTVASHPHHIYALFEALLDEVLR